MTRFEFRLPDIGEGVTEGEIVNWLAQVGDSVEEDQELVEVMTDKATVTIGAPKGGRLLETHGRPGEMVPVGSVLAVLDVGGAAASDAVAASQPSVAESREPSPSGAASPPVPSSAPAVGDGSGGPVGNLREELPGMVASAVEAAPAGSFDAIISEQPLAAPATRRLARELGVDLRRVPPTGKAGRVTSEDVERFAAVQAAADITPPSPPTATAIPRAGTPIITDPSVEERISIRGLRKRIFENMARSRHTAAHFNYVEECNVGPLIALRERVRPHAEAQGVKLTFLPFIIKAVVSALRIHPDLNCWVDDAQHEIVRRRTYDIGLAVATEAGLIVPVVRWADRRSILDLAREIERLGSAARAGKTAAADLGGSTFTVTSLGKLGGLLAPPIINYPEVGIMGVHAIKRRPVVRDDAIVVGDVMMLTWSFDHRIIDGHVGAAFAQEIIALLESPDRLLISMS
ncbi:MAG: 2-oxo acid dehydrogenase subunit E2 [Polyangiaceae bacterium]|nr:2-oxo acid dehydrogenase subunit E2 [Polyangiaceae bacterium]